MTNHALCLQDGTVIPENELVFSGIRAQGPGGQNVNKVASAVQLKFDVKSSQALSPLQKESILALPDRRIAKSGNITIKAQRTRSQDRNRTDALERLGNLLEKALSKPRARVATQPSRRSRQKMLANKQHRSRLKRLRSSIDD